ncbi:MAG: permease [Eubacteriales bacterium]|nr:permease [Eubacteriales bacterium]
MSKSNKKKLGIIVVVFLLAYFLPIESQRVQGAILSAFAMLKDYAREHVLLCLVPAFFIAGAVGVFISQDSVIKYFGAKAKKWVSYTVASVSGFVLAVCSCTVLPLFAGIYSKGAGIGPATTFLYAGPAINVTAILITANVLGWELGLARMIGAVVFSIVIGLAMQFLFRKEEAERISLLQTSDQALLIDEDAESKPLWQTIVFIGSMIGILVFANWKKPETAGGLGDFIFTYKWVISAALLLIVIYAAVKWLDKKEKKSWLSETWGFALQIFPLLFAGVMISGVLFGLPGVTEGIIPSSWVAGLVGGNSLGANLFASVAGAFMYFATLTEVPILQGLIGAGMGQGPALALLLAGPALSLPSMLVIRSVLGTKKTVTYVSLVVVMSTVAGLLFGAIV